LKGLGAEGEGRGRRLLSWISVGVGDPFKKNPAVETGLKREKGVQKIDKKGVAGRGQRNRPWRLNGPLIILEGGLRCGVVCVRCCEWKKGTQKGRHLKKIHTLIKKLRDWGRKGGSLNRCRETAYGKKRGSKNHSKKRIALYKGDPGLKVESLLKSQGESQGRVIRQKKLSSASPKTRQQSLRSVIKRERTT